MRDMRGLGAPLLICLAACAKGGAAGPDATGPGDSCSTATYFADADGDGHGDANAAVVACEPPPNTVAISDDCDDADAHRFPGNPEICDGLDSDCDPATVEVCPAGCTPRRRPPPDDTKTYLFCDNGQAWNTARTTCTTAGYKLTQIDSAAENTFIRNTANSLFGAVDLHIGGTDQVTEGAWIWDGSDQFWQGGAGGTAVGNHFANWAAGEPNNDNGEDCAEMKPAGNWNDGNCGDGQRFVCRD